MKAIAFLATVAMTLLLAAQPATAAPRIEASADPLAPAGSTPIVLLEATGLEKGRQYRLLAGQRSGESPWRDGPQGKEEVCQRALGSLSFQAAEDGRIQWDPRPSFFFTAPELVPSYYSSYEPCTGGYVGMLLVKKRNGARPVLRFTLSVPALKLKYLRYRGDRMTLGSQAGSRGGVVHHSRITDSGRPPPPEHSFSREIPVCVGSAD